MPEFLLEVGCEELPASFVERAYTDLANALSKELEGLGLKNSEPVAMGTPRRLIVSFSDLKDRQEDSTKEQRGPSLQAAFGPDGNPTGALLGFCKSQGITPDDLRKDEQYVWVTKHIPGRDTREVLAEILPKIILGLNFDKSMRWGSSKVRFARPIRWVLAALGGELVSFNVEDVPSSLLTRGHRFYAPDEFEAKNLAELTSQLRKNFVEPEIEKRKAIILEEAKKVAKGAPEITDDLLDENAFLCEWPTAICGSFPESYLELPEPVLVTAMAKHERMFPIRDAAGKLTNSFVFIRNSGEDETVTRGCEWVLGARFNDARFFFEQDQKHDLNYFLEKTNDILFQAQLGTVRQRADRLASLAAIVAHHIDSGNATTQDLARQAGLLAKADLATGLVSELSSLQGVIGAQYAKAEGKADPVVNALSLQYKSPSRTFSGDSDNVAACLIVADQVDKLVGYLGLGIEPSGSSDPFGLRKSVTTLITLAENWDAQLGFVTLVADAVKGYASQGVELDETKIYSSLDSIFRGRYEALFSEYSYDVLQAVLSVNSHWLTDPKMVRGNLEIVQSLKADSLFVQTASRPINIVNAAKKKDEPMADTPILKKSDMDTVEAEALYDAIYTPKVDANDIKGHFLALVSPINAFFDNNMIMAEDKTVRFHRLSLAKVAADLFTTVGDFTKLEG